MFLFIIIQNITFNNATAAETSNLSGTRHCGEYLDCNYGISPIIDGEISDREWLDANSITFNNFYGEVTVYFKHNNYGLIVAFNIPDTSYPDFDDSGVALDTDHDGVTSNTDYFLELNRNGRYDTRTGNDYQNHDTSEPIGWEAMYTSSASGWQVEYNISFELLDITSSESKTIGIAFHTLDNTNGEYDWPTDCHILHPDTFADISSTDNWGGYLQNLAPLLTSGAIEPLFGYTDTEFTFSVHYFDRDGDLPETQNIIIDEIYYDMELQEGENAIDGIYEYKTTLTKGDHTYYFEFNDGEFDSRFPKQESLEGPKVEKIIEGDDGWSIPSFDLLVLIGAILTCAILLKRYKPTTN